MTSFAGANLTRTYTATQLANDGSAPGIGDIYHAKGGKKYKFVRYQAGAGTVAAVAGKAAYLYATSGSSTGNVNDVTMDLTDGLTGQVAGVLQAVIADQSYGWIQTWGTCTLATTLSSGADGDPIGPGAADGAMSRVEGTASAAASKAQFGYAIDASAKIVFLRCE
jgi:hypothetical protein